ncbi:hypothetical protein H2200_007570 [Cladophialophora chaetospira]|uniref:Uncharacterized protein n=1 Tax=Cladophialophora chaetospira TaxID=386627 RepID=A0AA38X605_9EURO|nr:hypothetical protein H2200_007570 [Cladophialophora chaetospira]
MAPTPPQLPTREDLSVTAAKGLLPPAPPVSPSKLLAKAPPFIVFGPGDCVCADFSDPTRLSGVNLPKGLQKLVSKWSSEDWDLDSDLDSDLSSGYDSGSRTVSTSSSPERVRPASPRRPPLSPPRRSRSRRRSSVNGEDEQLDRNNREEPPTDGEDTQMRVHRREESTSRNGAADANGVAKPPRREETILPTTKTLARRVSCLAFGSRPGDYVIIYQEKGYWYLDGNVFKRLSTLQDWIVPDGTGRAKSGRSRIYSRSAGSIKLFLGPENTYFAYNGITREYNHNIQTREFRDWLKICASGGGRRRYYIDDSDDSSGLKEEYAPTSLALGPDDMFCWICQRDFKVSHTFRKAFPSVVRYLQLTKRKRILNQVTFTTSTYTQPGSNLPYYVLTTPDGTCMISVPSSATGIVSKTYMRWSALNIAKRDRDVHTDANSGTQDMLGSIDEELIKAEKLAFSNGPYKGKAVKRMENIVDALESIKEICDNNWNVVIFNRENWKRTHLAERARLIVNDLNERMEEKNRSKERTKKDKEDEEGEEDIKEKVKRLFLDILDTQKPINEVIKNNAVPENKKDMTEAITYFRGLASYVADVKSAQTEVDTIARNIPYIAEASLSAKIQFILADYKSKMATLTKIEQNKPRGPLDDETTRDRIKRFIAEDAKETEKLKKQFASEREGGEWSGGSINKDISDPDA